MSDYRTIDELITAARVAHKVHRAACMAGKTLDIIPASRAYSELFDEVMKRAGISRTKTFAVVAEGKELS